jgi:hypothetical protein
MSDWEVYELHPSVWSAKYKHCFKHTGVFYECFHTSKQEAEDFAANPPAPLVRMLERDCGETQDA